MNRELFGVVTMVVDYNAITTIVSVVAIILALVALIIENRANRLALQTGILLDLLDKMESTELRNFRRTAAARLIKDEKANYEIGAVLDFFATVAFLYERRAIDRDLTYKQFSWWLIRWWLCTEQWVMNERTTSDPTGWKTLERVSKILIRREHADGYPEYTQDQLRMFLHEEADIPLSE